MDIIAIIRVDNTSVAVTALFRVATCCRVDVEMNVDGLLIVLFACEIFCKVAKSDYIREVIFHFDNSVDVNHKIWPS